MAMVSIYLWNVSPRKGGGGFFGLVGGWCWELLECKADGVEMRIYLLRYVYMGCAWAWACVWLYWLTVT